MGVSRRSGRRASRGFVSGCVREIKGVQNRPRALGRRCLCSVVGRWVGARWPRGPTLRAWAGGWMARRAPRRVQPVQLDDDLALAGEGVVRVWRIASAGCAEAGDGVGLRGHDVTALGAFYIGELTGSGNAPGASVVWLCPVEREALQVGDRPDRGYRLWLRQEWPVLRDRVLDARPGQRRSRYRRGRPRPPAQQPPGHGGWRAELPRRLRGRAKRRAVRLQLEHRAGTQRRRPDRLGRSDHTELAPRLLGRSAHAARSGLGMPGRR